MKKLLLALVAIALVTGIALAAQTIGTTSSVQGTIWVRHAGIQSGNLRLSEGMKLLDDDQLFLERGSSFKATNNVGQWVTIQSGDKGYWNAETNQKLPPNSDWARCSGITYSDFY